MHGLCLYWVHTHINVMRIEFYRSGQLLCTESIQSWTHFETAANRLDEGRYKLIIYKANGNKTVRSISVRNNQVLSKSSEVPIKTVLTAQ